MAKYKITLTVEENNPEEYIEGICQIEELRDDLEVVVSNYNCMRQIGDIEIEEIVVDCRKLLESKGFTLNTYLGDGKFWELVVKDDEELKRHICNVFQADVELLDSNITDIDTLILQCAEDYSRCIFFYDCNSYNMETEEFMRCVDNI